MIPDTSLRPPASGWTSPNSNYYHIYENQILGWFKDTVDQGDIENFITTHNLRVIFSWFEPAEEGNEIAWFQFEYDPEEYETFDDAYTAFSEDELIKGAMPNLQSNFRNMYTDPDRLWMINHDPDEF